MNLQLNNTIDQNSIKKSNMQTIKSVGPDDFRNAKNVDRIVESSH